LNDKLERMWKNVVFTYFKVLPQRLAGGPEKNNENSQDRRTLGRDSKFWPPVYETRLLIIMKQLSIFLCCRGRFIGNWNP